MFLRASKARARIPGVTYIERKVGEEIRKGGGDRSFGVGQTRTGTRTATPLMRRNMKKETYHIPRDRHPSDPSSSDPSGHLGVGPTLEMASILFHILHSVREKVKAKSRIIMPTTFNGIQDQSSLEVTVCVRYSKVESVGIAAVLAAVRKPIMQYRWIRRRHGRKSSGSCSLKVHVTAQNVKGQNS